MPISYLFPDNFFLRQIIVSLSLEVDLAANVLWLYFKTFRKLFKLVNMGQVSAVSHLLFYEYLTSSGSHCVSSKYWGIFHDLNTLAKLLLTSTLLCRSTLAVDYNDIFVIGSHRLGRD